MLIKYSYFQLVSTSLFSLSPESGQTSRSFKEGFSSLQASSNTFQLSRNVSVVSLSLSVTLQHW